MKRADQYSFNSKHDDRKTKLCNYHETFCRNSNILETVGNKMYISLTDVSMRQHEESTFFFCLKEGELKLLMAY